MILNGAYAFETEPDVYFVCLFKEKIISKLDHKNLVKSFAYYQF